jgi:TPP-dependent pyruvate/acetoin dehydrogenase alpha subunit
MESNFKPIKSYNLNKDTLLKMYFTMTKIRDFENAITDVYSRGLMNGLAHLYIGEEAIATGGCSSGRKRKTYTEKKSDRKKATFYSRRVIAGAGRLYETY